MDARVALIDGDMNIVVRGVGVTSGTITTDDGGFTADVSITVT